jgi:NhaA family Na+:H+ antiporter
MASSGRKNKVYEGPKILTPFARFAQFEAAGGVLLILCTIAALVWANSPWWESYFHLWEVPVTLGFGEFVINKNLHHWINDGLMAVFFFVVGLEIKRELLAGELSTPKKAVLPFAAALGGMLVPAAIYAALNWGKPGAPGWGIPMATDIAFALGILTLVGSRVPLGLKVFLTALAIVDDLGAVLVIAIFYTTELSFTSLGFGGAFLVAMLVVNKLGFRSPLLYLALGFLAWVGFLKSGVHATIAGVLSALMIPSTVRIDPLRFLRDSQQSLKEFEEATNMGDKPGVLLTGFQQEAIATLEERAEWAQPPMQRLEHGLIPWVTFFIMPIFAFANAGVRLDKDIAEALTHPVSLGIILGLVLGKQIGITIFSLLAVKMKVADMPERSNSRALYYVSWLGGIGFTMSLFVANLAFVNAPDLLDTAKVGILSASLISGVAGYILLLKKFKAPATA